MQNPLYPTENMYVPVYHNTSINPRDTLLMHGKPVFEGVILR